MERVSRLMITILSYYFLSASLFASDLTAYPFSDALHKENPHLNVIEEDPLFIAVRSEKLNFTQKKCEDVRKSLNSKNINEEIKSLELKEGALNTNALFTSLNSDEIKMIEGCDHFPCKVKLNENEFNSLKTTPINNRLNRYRELVKQRVSEAHLSNVRKQYEEPLVVTDGMKALKKWADFKLLDSDFDRTSSEFKMRELTLGHKNGYSVVRQILKVKKVDRIGQFHLTIESLYTDHYFDGWVEEIDFLCVSENSGVFSQSILIENDLLKSKDLFSRMMRPKLRHGIREAITKLLKKRQMEWFNLSE